MEVKNCRYQQLQENPSSRFPAENRQSHCVVSNKGDEGRAPSAEGCSAIEDQSIRSSSHESRSLLLTSFALARKGEKTVKSESRPHPPFRTPHESLNRQNIYRYVLLFSKPFLRPLPSSGASLLRHLPLQSPHTALQSSHLLVAGHVATAVRMVCCCSSPMRALRGIFTV